MAGEKVSQDAGKDGSLTGDPPGSPTKQVTLMRTLVTRADVDCDTFKLQSFEFIRDPSRHAWVPAQLQQVQRKLQEKL